MNKTFFVARQPIFDVEQNIWGYELLFRDSFESTAAQIDDPYRATITVSSCGFLRSTMGIAENSKIFINFTEESILNKIPFGLPSSSTVIEILENVKMTPELRLSLLELKNEGYILALDDFVGDEQYGEILSFIDILKCDCQLLSFEQLAEIRTKYDHTGCMFLAEKIDSENLYFSLRDKGFDLFQGYYFAKPQNLRGEKLSSQNASRLLLAAEIEKDELDLDEIVRILKLDVSLSYRLLLYINSCSFSFRTKINSIKQALVLLGFKKIRSWLRLIIYSDLLDESSHPGVFKLALQRAHFLENIGNRNPFNIPTEALFLTGIFSLIEAMTHIPAAKVLENLPFRNDLKEAILGKENTLGMYLTLARAVEDGDFSKIHSLSMKLKANESFIFDSYRSSINETSNDMDDLKI